VSLVRSCAHPISLHKITLYIFCLVLFCTHRLSFFFNNIIFMHCLNIFWPYQISSIKCDPLTCVHRHALFVCKFSSPYSVFVCFLLTVLVWSPTVVFQHFSKVINRVGRLDDRHGSSPIPCDTVTLFVYTD